ncbi:MAG: SCO family protein [Pseudomonadota bacterium]|nr:SCO family protein [Pseudomonadota bacterium]
MKREIFLFAALLVGAASVRAEADAALKAGIFTPARMAPDFALRGSDGAELNLSRYRGKVVLLGFGFTSCAEVCPITLATLAQASKRLGALASELQIVYITVDPERDDAARMKKYLAAFNPAFIGGTGSAEQLAAVRKDYGILAAKKIGADSSYSHSSFVYLIDREGRLRALMTYGRAADDYVHDVRILLGAP